MLNKGQSNLLEKMQKRCLRAIYGYDHDYETLLSLSGLQTLAKRREIAFKKFTSKTVKNQKYEHWFPMRPIARITRSTSIYLEETAVGNRLYNSPIFSMRRLLNNTKSHEIVDMSGLFNNP